MPSNQAAFHEWVLAVHRRVFHSETRPEGPMLPLETPAVRGLIVYGVKCGETRFYGVWIEWSGTFIGWMRIQPHIAGIDSDYAVGEVLQRPVFMGITLDLSGHDATRKLRIDGVRQLSSSSKGEFADTFDVIARFTAALKNAAWDLGVAGG